MDCESFQRRDESSSWSLPVWLAAREDVGIHRHKALRTRHGIISPNQLASVSAWNPARMRNMILAVGPGTPASVLWQTAAEQEDDEDGGAGDVVFDDDDDDSSNQASDMSQQVQHDDADQQDSNDDDDEDDATAEDMQVDDEERRIPAEAQAVIRDLMQANNMYDGSSSEDEDDAHVAGWGRTSHNRRYPSLRHGGCINTACWLDCEWQLSTPGQSSSVRAESSPRACPTQLITSGDDRLVKVWDVKDAMGMSNPLEGGWDTFSPLADMSKPDPSAIHKTWKSYYRKRQYSRMAGSVIHLATLATGHRGNVFHATPVADQPGKILTCGADGSLRSCDLQAESFSVVVSLSDSTQYLFNPVMAFSHIFLTGNTGLLCSEEGLHRFDLRLCPREQDRRSLLAGVQGCLSDDYCKSCAVWSPHVQSRSDSDASFIESNYVFAGSRSEHVGLLDLRMGGGSSRIVQSYKPRVLEETSNVSVSGIDVSKDGRELLVSYESDQIYSFPILPTCSSRAGPTLEEIDSFASSADKPVHELVSYGGHFNRFTFLKNAKYAGPNDDYICTGSDSGCGWIYERKTGTVVSLLGADKCTCNGLVPHPSLPFFISYGIDSTAKLWRATPPVNLQADDSPSGRNKCSLESEYEMSPVSKSWATVQKFVERDASPGMLPDFVASPAEMASSYRFSPRESRAICGVGSPKFGNSIRLLPSILRRNRHECYRSFQRQNGTGRGGDTPVEQPVDVFSQRVSLARLRLQADRLGLKWNLTQPWAFQSDSGSPPVHPADLVPDTPSDWLLYDPSVTGAPYEQKNFNKEEFGDILSETLFGDPAFLDSPKEDASQLPPWLEGVDLPDKEDTMANQWLSDMKDEYVLKSRQLFYATIILLKKGGNQAMKDGLLFAAARRYDKTLHYCAVAFMKHIYSQDELKHLACKNPVAKTRESGEDGVNDSAATSSTPVWTPLIQLLVTTRLNMALLLLRPEMSQPGRAMEQARAALDFLHEFTVDEKKDSEILALQAKAHFRLGSAKLELGNYSEAVECFEASLQDNKGNWAGKPDALVARRLQEAKRKLKSKKKVEKKRYERAFRRVPSSDAND